MLFFNESSFYLDFYSLNFSIYFYKDFIYLCNYNFVEYNKLPYYNLSDWVIFSNLDYIDYNRFFNYKLYFDNFWSFNKLFLQSNIVYLPLYYDYTMSSLVNYNYISNFTSSDHNFDYLIYCTIWFSKLEPFSWIWNQQICMNNYSDSNKIDFLDYSNYLYDYFFYWFKGYNWRLNSHHLFFFETNIWNISQAISWNLSNFWSLGHNQILKMSYVNPEIVFDFNNLVTLKDNAVLINITCNNGHFFELLSSHTFIYVFYFFCLQYYFTTYLFF